MIKMEEDNNETNKSQKSLANRSFQDIQFLMTFPLISPSAVLNYFSVSPFFDINSNNQTLIAQGIEQSLLHLQQMTGIEFSVNERLSKPPRLFVINKQYRFSLRHVEVREVYYCLDGAIFQCPDLLEVLKTRLSKVTLALTKSYHEIMKEDDENKKSKDDVEKESKQGVAAVQIGNR
jgi:hypothetical protein